MDKYERREFLILSAQVIAAVLGLVGFVALCAFVSMWFVVVAFVVFVVLMFADDFMEVVVERAEKKKKADRG